MFPVPVLLGLSALWGAAKISDANDKIRSANSINSQAARIADSAKNLVESANSEMNNSLEKLGRTETNIMDGNVNNFVKMFEKIYSEFEYKKNYSGLQKLEQMGFKKKVIEEMKVISNKFEQISSTGELKQIEGNSFGAIGLLGAGTIGGSVIEVLQNLMKLKPHFMKQKAEWTKRDFMNSVAKIFPRFSRQ